MFNFIHIPKNAGTSIKSICNKDTLSYCGHNTNVFTRNISNQLVVLMDPIHRFQSSVHYCLEKYSHEPQIQKLLEIGCDSPEKWLQAWKDRDHPHHTYLMKEIANRTHRIGRFKPKWKWTYCPQSYWIKTPKYVLIMENITTEWGYFRDKVLHRNIELPQKNTTTETTCELSEGSLAFLKKQYAMDFAFYTQYSNTPIEQRIPPQ